MRHPRNEIREAVVGLLKGKGDDRPTSAGARVFNSRDIPLTFNTMPAVLVYTIADDADAETSHVEGPRRRTMDLRVEVYGMGDNGADLVDECAWQVEVAIEANPTLERHVESCRHRRTEIAFAKEGEDALFAAVMEFDVVYWIAPPSEPGQVPRLFLGIDPDTGPGNEHMYWEVGEGMP